MKFSIYGAKGWIFLELTDQFRTNEDCREYLAHFYAWYSRGSWITPYSREPKV